MTKTSSVYKQAEVAGGATPAGSTFVAVASSNPVTRTFVWTPTRGQEGFKYDLCFEVKQEVGAQATYGGKDGANAHQGPRGVQVRPVLRGEAQVVLEPLL